MAPAFYNTAPVPLLNACIAPKSPFQAFHLAVGTQLVVMFTAPHLHLVNAWLLGLSQPLGFSSVEPKALRARWGETPMAELTCGDLSGRSARKMHKAIINVTHRSIIEITSQSSPAHPTDSLPREAPTASPAWVARQNTSS